MKAADRDRNVNWDILLGCVLMNYYYNNINKRYGVFVLELRLMLGLLLSMLLLVTATVCCPSVVSNGYSLLSVCC